MSLKRPAHRLTFSQALTLGPGGGVAACGVPETYRERLSGVASGQGLEGQLPFSFC